MKFLTSEFESAIQCSQKVHKVFSAEYLVMTYFLFNTWFHKVPNLFETLCKLGALSE